MATSEVYAKGSASGRHVDVDVERKDPQEKDQEDRVQHLLRSLVQKDTNGILISPSRVATQMSRLAQGEAPEVPHWQLNRRLVSGMLASTATLIPMMFLPQPELVVLPLLWWSVLMWQVYKFHCKEIQRLRTFQRRTGEVDTPSGTEEDIHVADGIPMYKFATGVNAPEPDNGFDPDIPSNGETYLDDGDMPSDDDANESDMELRLGDYSEPASDQTSSVTFHPRRNYSSAGRGTTSHKAHHAVRRVSQQVYSQASQMARHASKKVGVVLDKVIKKGTRCKSEPWARLFCGSRVIQRIGAFLISGDNFIFVSPPRDLEYRCYYNADEQSILVADDADDDVTSQMSELSLSSTESGATRIPHSLRCYQKELLKAHPNCCDNYKTTIQETRVVRRLPWGWTFGFLCVGHLLCTLCFVVHNAGMGYCYQQSYERTNAIKHPYEPPRFTAAEKYGGKVSQNFLATPFISYVSMLAALAFSTMRSALSWKTEISLYHRSVGDPDLAPLIMHSTFRTTLGPDMWRKPRYIQRLWPFLFFCMSVVVAIFPYLSPFQSYMERWGPFKQNFEIAVATLVLGACLMCMTLYIALQLMRSGTMRFFNIAHQRLQLLTLLLNRVALRVPLEAPVVTTSASDLYTPLLSGRDQAHAHTMSAVEEERELLRWWKLRDLYVHGQLPLLYRFTSWPLSTVMVFVMTTTGYSAGKALTRGVGTLLAGPALQVLGIGVILAISFFAAAYAAARLYLEQQRHFEILGYMAAFHPNSNIRRHADQMQKLSQKDLYPQVFGIDIKPGIVNLMMGYIVTAGGSVVISLLRQTGVV